MSVHFSDVALARSLARARISQTPRKLDHAEAGSSCRPLESHLSPVVQRRRSGDFNFILIERTHKLFACADSRLALWLHSHLVDRIDWRRPFRPNSMAGHLKRQARQANGKRAPRRFGRHALACQRVRDTIKSYITRGRADRLWILPGRSGTRMAAAHPHGVAANQPSNRIEQSRIEWTRFR